MEYKQGSLVKINNDNAIFYVEYKIEEYESNNSTHILATYNTIKLYNGGAVRRQETWYKENDSSISSLLTDIFCEV